MAVVRGPGRSGGKSGESGPGGGKNWVMDCVPQRGVASRREGRRDFLFAGVEADAHQGWDHGDGSKVIRYGPRMLST